MYISSQSNASVIALVALSSETLMLICVYYIDTPKHYVILKEAYTVATMYKLQATAKLGDATMLLATSTSATRSSTRST